MAPLRRRHVRRTEHRNEEHSMPDDVRVSLEKEALDAHKEEYKDLVASFQGIDAKAQGVVAIAGIFIGGIFAFLNSNNFARNEVADYLLTIAVILLTGSVLLAILVLRVRDTSGVPTGAHTNKLLEDLLVLDDEAISAALSNFYGDKVRAWAGSVIRLRVDVEKKSDFVWGAQLMLFLGIICVAVTALDTLL